MCCYHNHGRYKNKKRERLETGKYSAKLLFRPPRNVRKYLDRQIVTIAYSSVSGCNYYCSPGCHGHQRLLANGQPQLIGNRAHFLITSQALEKDNKRKERGKGKRSMIIIADCCNTFVAIRFAFSFRYI